MGGAGVRARGWVGGRVGARHVCVRAAAPQSVAWKGLARKEQHEQLGAPAGGAKPLPSCAGGAGTPSFRTTCGPRRAEGPAARPPPQSARPRRCFRTLRPPTPSCCGAARCAAPRAPCRRAGLGVHGCTALHEYCHLDPCARRPSTKQRPHQAAAATQGRRLRAQASAQTSTLGAPLPSALPHPPA